MNPRRNAFGTESLPLFFPHIKPDELLYSAFSRYHLINDPTSHERTTLELMGVKSCFVPKDLPSRLQRFIDVLPGKGFLTLDDLIEGHTLYPYYRPFLPASRALKIKKYMAGAPKTGQISGSLGIGSCRLPMQETLRCCPKCIKADTKKYGFAYWHRSHQTTGVLFCHEHRKALMETVVRFHQRILGLGYFHLKRELITCPSVPEAFSSRDYEQLVWIAEKVHWLLNHPMPPTSPEEIHLRFKSYLGQQSLVTLNGCFRQKQIVEAFRDFYSENILNVLSSSLVPTRHGHVWVSEQLREKHKTSHPLLYLLLIQCFGIDLGEFLQKHPKNHKPFGEGPWPCLNPAAEHYKQDVVEDCVIHHFTQDTKLVGKFYCRCGFFYSREGPDIDKDDRYNKRHVIRYGPVWDKKMLKLLQENGLSVPEAAKRLGCDKSNVYRRLKLINEKCFSDDQSSAFQNNRLKKRQELLAYIEENPGKSRMEIVQNNKTLISWQRRNDNVWLQEILPKRGYYEGSTSSRKNWPKIDEKHASLVNVVVEEIKAMRPLVRASRQLIAEMAGCSKYLDKLHKLPRLSKQLERYEENIEKFQVRKMLKEARRLLDEGNYTFPRLVRECHIYNVKNAPHIQEALDNFLSENGLD